MPHDDLVEEGDDPEARPSLYERKPWVQHRTSCAKPDAESGSRRDAVAGDPPEA